MGPIEKLITLVAIVMCVAAACSPGPARADWTDASHTIYIKNSEACLNPYGARVADPTNNATAVYRPCSSDICPPEPQSKWRFDGRSLTTAKFGNITTDKACLDCLSEESDCELRVHNCNGKPSQAFFLQVHKSQLDSSLSSRRIFFTINSYRHRDRCLTRTTKFVVYQGTEPDMSVDAGRPCLRPEGRISQETLRLTPCTGADSQSFFLESGWFEQVNQLRKDSMGTQALRALTPAPKNYVEEPNAYTPYSPRLNVFPNIAWPLA